MALVVDASVAIKWVIDEEGSDRAHALIGEDSIVAPHLLVIECANVLRTKVRKGVLTRALAVEALEWLAAVPARTVPDRDFAMRAHSIAVELDRSAYDSLYLAVALHERATLVTADGKFARAAASNAAAAPHVRLLAG